MSIGNRIQAARKKANLSQKELGEKLGVSASMIGQYENGLRNPKLATIQKIAAALNTHWTNIADETTAMAYDAGYAEGIEDGFANGEWKHQFSKVLWEQFGYSYSNIEVSMITLFSQLNNEGQQKAVERVEELTEILRYKKELPQE